MHKKYTQSGYKHIGEKRAVRVHLRHSGLNHIVLGIANDYSMYGYASSILVFFSSVPTALMALSCSIT